MYTLTIHPDGTHVSDYHEEAIDRDYLTEAIGGSPYIEPLAEDADAVTSKTPKNRAQPNPWATAIAWAFGKESTSYHGDVIITAGTDSRGGILGLNHTQVEALTAALKTLRSHHNAGMPQTFTSAELEFLDAFTPHQGPKLSAEANEDDGEESKSNTGIIGAVCLIIGLLLGGATWLLPFGDDEDTDVVTEGPEEGAEEEAGVTAEELNELSEELAQRESDIEDYEEDMEDLDEREAELDGREEGLDEREQDLDSREGDVSERESDAENRESDLDEREEGLDDREEDLDEREQDLDDQPAEEPDQPEDQPGQGQGESGQ